MPMNNAKCELINLTMNKDNNISELNPVLKIQENYSISDNLALFNNIKIKKHY